MSGGNPSGEIAPHSQGEEIVFGGVLLSKRERESERARERMFHTWEILGPFVLHLSWGTVNIQSFRNLGRGAGSAIGGDSNPLFCELLFPLDGSGCTSPKTGGKNTKFLFPATEPEVGITDLVFGGVFF